MGKNFSCNNVTKDINIVGVGKVGKRDSTGKKTDFYETPYTLTRRFLDAEYFDKSLSVCEPACGNGAITKILNEKWNKELITSYDIRDKNKSNFLWEMDNYDYVITNPPFSLSLQFIQKAKSVATKKFAFLLPLAYLHGKKRYDEIYTDKKYGLEKVYIFTRYPMLGEPLRDDGKYTTGMMVYAWYVWTNGYGGKPMIDWLDNNEDILSKKEIKEETKILTDQLYSCYT